MTDPRLPLTERPFTGTFDIAPGPNLDVDLEPGTLGREVHYESGLELKARSQWSYARQRFFRHRLAMASIVVLILVFLAGIFATQLAPYDPSLPSADITLKPTLEGQHYFGTDQIGRDYFSRTLYGIRSTEQVSLLAALVATIAGTFIGACAG